MARTVYTHDSITLVQKPGHSLVAVRVEMPHVAQYGKKSTMDLTYGCSSPVAVGDTVLCPPTRLNQKWTRGTVLAVHHDVDAAGYRGRVKYVKPLR